MKKADDRNVVWHRGEVTADDRRKAHGHGGAVVWLTGLSGSGKSTVAHRLEKDLIARGVFAYVLDGDNVRHGLNSDLGFAPSDRTENIRRVGEVAALFADAGAVVISAFISPYRADRDRVRERVGRTSFVEVFVDAPVEECERRDPKGLYRKARDGQIAQFTGVSAPYEEPLDPEVHLRTDEHPVAQCVAAICAYLESYHLI